MNWRQDELATLAPLTLAASGRAPWRGLGVAAATALGDLSLGASLESTTLRAGDRLAGGVTTTLGALARFGGRPTPGRRPTKPFRVGAALRLSGPRSASRLRQQGPPIELADVFSTGASWRQRLGCCGHLTLSSQLDYLDGLRSDRYEPRFGAELSAFEKGPGRLEVIQIRAGLWRRRDPTLQTPPVRSSVWSAGVSVTPQATGSLLGGRLRLDAGAQISGGRLIEFAAGVAFRYTRSFRRALTHVGP